MSNSLIFPRNAGRLHLSPADVRTILTVAATPARSWKKGELDMIRIKVLGLLIGASLVVGYEPTAEAAPPASPSAIEIYNANGFVEQVSHARRVARREVRRVHRYERRGLRRFHREERRYMRRHVY
jgi:hypothetical protein